MAVNNPSPASRAGGHPETAILIFPPLVHVFFGGFLLIVWVLASVMSMQTTEAWFLGITDATFKIDFTIFAQFPGFFDSSLSPETRAAFIFALGVQCVLLTAKIGLATVHAKVAKTYAITPTDQMIKSAKQRALGWNILSAAALILNAIADAVYSWSFGPLQSFAFCGILFLVTFYLGTFGIQNISAGASRMNQ